MMIPAPHWATDEIFAEGVAEAAERLGEPPATLRLGSLHEGKCVQIMHMGPPARMQPTVVRMHTELLPAQGLVPSGPHHQIYLNDPRRTAPAKVKTVVRQPVRARND